jgi:hypothetical protein
MSFDKNYFMLQKLLYLICLFFFTSISVKAQAGKLSVDEENGYTMNLCNSMLGSRQTSGLMSIQPSHMKIVSFTRSSSGKIDRIRGHYELLDKNSWIELFYEDDFAYGVVYSDNPTSILTPKVVGPGGAMKPYKGNMLSQAKALQKTLYNKLINEKEQVQELAVKKEKEDFSGEQTYDAGKSNVSEDVFLFVKQCVDECLKRGELHIFSNTLTVKIIDKNAAGKPVKIRANFMVKDWGSGKTFPEWAEILFDNSLAYVMYLSTGKLHNLEPGEIDRHMTKYYSTPLARWQKPETVYSADQLAKIKQLQQEFFLIEKDNDDKLFASRYMAVLKEQQEMGLKQNTTQIMRCLEKTDTTIKVNSGRYTTETKSYYEGGYRLEKEVVVPIYIKKKVPALKNGCKETLYIYGMEKYADNGEGDDIKYRSVMMTLEPGNVTEYFYIAPVYDDTKIKPGKIFYYSKPQTITVTGIK